jgi:hypothetical protein
VSGPTRRSLSELTELGVWLDTVVDLDDGEARITPSSRSLLLWAPNPRALIVLQGFKLPRPRRAAPEGKAAAVYEDWTRGRDASQVRELKVTWPRGSWSCLGPAISIAYRSDKFHRRGDAQDYQHEFGTGVRMYRLGTESRCVLAWRGGRLRITEDGIEG